MNVASLGGKRVFSDNEHTSMVFTLFVVSFMFDVYGYSDD